MEKPGKGISKREVYDCALQLGEVGAPETSGSVLLLPFAMGFQGASSVVGAAARVVSECSFELISETTRVACCAESPALRNAWVAALNGLLDARPASGETSDQFTARIRTMANHSSMYCSGAEESPAIMTARPVRPLLAGIIATTPAFLTHPCLPGEFDSVNGQDRQRVPCLRVVADQDPL